MPDIAIKNTTQKPCSYRDLLGCSWTRLHPAIQARFAEHAQQEVEYQGVMSQVYLSFAGKVLAQVCRLIGKPLALYSQQNVPVTVKVYPDPQLGGLTWERNYHFNQKPSNKVQSTKCIRDSGLMEMLGCGIGMQLGTFERDGALHFASEYYFIELAGLKLKLPRWLTPGKTIVYQKALNEEQFEFGLEVKHKLFGVICRQVGVFQQSK